jgi:hypothetical protein
MAVTRTPKVESQTQPGSTDAVSKPAGPPPASLEEATQRIRNAMRTAKLDAQVRMNPPMERVEIRFFSNQAEAGEQALLSIGATARDSMGAKMWSFGRFELAVDVYASAVEADR